MIGEKEERMFFAPHTKRPLRFPQRCAILSI